MEKTANHPQLRPPASVVLGLLVVLSVLGGGVYALFAPWK